MGALAHPDLGDDGDLEIYELYSSCFAASSFKSFYFIHGALVTQVSKTVNILNRELTTSH